MGKRILRLVVDIPVEICDAPEWRRHAVRYCRPGWMPGTGRYVIAEGFSERLPSTLLSQSSRRGSMLDPFAGGGTSLLAAAGCGWTATGVELMPLGRFITASYQALAELGGKVGGALEGMPRAVASASGWIDIGRRGMEHAGGRSLEAERQVCAFATLCAIDECARASERHPRRGADAEGKMRDICARLARLAPDSYIGMRNCTMIEGDCREAVEGMPAFDMIITSPPFYGRWMHGIEHAVENEVVAMAVDHGCHREAASSGSAEGGWRDDGIGERLVGILELSNATREFKEHCSMLGWLLVTAERALRPGGSLHVVIENPTAMGTRLPLDEALMSCAEAIGLLPTRITRMPSFKEVRRDERGPRSISMLSVQR
jgi:hypothetical protein